MSDKFKAMFDEARDAGIDPDWVTKFESAFEATPLREENKATKERMREIAEANQRYRDSLLETKFSAYNVSIKPSALRIPDDLDVTDDEKVEGWLVQSGLTSAKPTTEPEVRATHDRIAAAANEGGSYLPNDLAALDPSKMSEDEFYERAAALEAARNK